ncbi:unnamed protein product [Lupinus luteus]|uniref:Uncharacterized protein n=1 Tax=Lupinus luteus TaxID=3873 RepID=A0AAV1XW92_LUPLU
MAENNARSMFWVYPSSDILLGDPLVVCWIPTSAFFCIAEDDKNGDAASCRRRWKAR